jgi:uncharacterized protein (DUF433 family)
MDDARITVEAGKRSGQPCIRGMRITVWDVLGWLAAGKTEDQIIDDYPELEKDDFRAVYEYAARLGRDRRFELPTSSRAKSKAC